MRLKKSIVIAVSTVLILLIVIQLSIIIAPFRQTPKRSDAIIVLGAQLWGDKPSPMLQYRLEKAFELYNGGYGDKIIVSGAQGSDELITEALAMKTYFVEAGVPEEKIFEEDKSYNTYENIHYSNKIMKSQGLKSAVIVTNTFHVHRSLMIARRLNMDVSGGVAPSYPNFALTSKFYMRETLAYIKDFILVRGR